MKRRTAVLVMAMLAGSAPAAFAAGGWPPDLAPGKACGPDKAGQFVRLKTAAGKPDGAFVCAQVAPGKLAIVWVPSVPLKDSGLSATGPAEPTTTKAAVTPAGTRSVTVEISGTADDVTITYVVDTDTKQVEHVAAAAAGTVTVDVAPGTKFAVLLRNWSTGTATCRVTVKGFPQTLRKTAAQGERADCAFTVP